MKVNQHLKLLALVMVFLFGLSACNSAAATIKPSSSPTTENYPNSSLLVSTRWLNDHLDDSGLIIVDTRKDSDYAASHVKNAINLVPALFDAASASVPSDKSDLAGTSESVRLFGQSGISNKSQVVVYGTNVDANAGRIFWDLEYLGNTDVRILDGGFDKFKNDGYQITTEKTLKNQVTFTANVDSSRLATKAYVLSTYSKSNFAVVDSRNATDFVVKRIPKAINILVADYLNSDGSVKSVSDLKALLGAKGITQEKTIITNCYVGYRSAQAYFIFRLMGYSVSNYDGSTTEWFADSSLPTEP